MFWSLRLLLPEEFPITSVVRGGGGGVAPERIEIFWKYTMPNAAKNATATNRYDIMLKDVHLYLTEKQKQYKDCFTQ